MGILYVVGTPIGNLGDITLRAAETLRSVPLVIAEDTRVAWRLLKSLDATPRVMSFHRHSSPARLRAIIDFLSKCDAALVSDAGTPGVNDPGGDLVAEAVRHGNPIVPLPGPSSIITALSVSGFNADRFTAFGFLPSNGSSRRRVLRAVASETAAAVLLETSHRLCSALMDMENILGDRELVICREMTKLYEEIWRGNSAAAREHFKVPRGEFVIVAAPLSASARWQPKDETKVEDSLILETAVKMRLPGMSRRDLADKVAGRLAIQRRRAYQIVHRLDTIDADVSDFIVSDEHWRCSD